MVIKVTTNDGEIGEAQLRLFNSKNNTIMVDKKAKNESKFMKALAFGFVKKTIDGLMSGKIDLESLNTNQIKPCELKIQSFDCARCQKVFKTKEVLEKHMNNHTIFDGHIENTLKLRPEQNKFPIVEENCDNCGIKFTLENGDKETALNIIFDHKDICKKNPYESQSICKHCDAVSKDDHDMRNITKQIHHAQNQRDREYHWMKS